MLVDESVQTSRRMERKAFQDRVIKEGMELWKKQKDHEMRKKFREQKEMKELLDNYWPFGKGIEARPRGLRNLRLEELFPNKDYRNATRHVGALDLGRCGGGAPIFSNGKKITRTREDPVLRFQFGSKDLRRCVDNNLRYKTNRQQQEEYKKELDKLVEEKKRKEKDEKTETIKFHQEQFKKAPPWGRPGPGGRLWRKPSAIGQHFFKSLGWSDEQTLKQLENNEIKDKIQENKKPIGKISNNNFLTANSHSKPSSRLDPLAYPRRNFIPIGKNRKLSPLSDNKDGVELVTLLAKDRKYPPRIPLCSSDITSEKKMGNNLNHGLWSRQGSAYLRYLGDQMMLKQQKMEEMKSKEEENSKQHFSTWTSFWGRPGNGAPLPEVRKKCLDNMLYPKLTPIGVH